MDGKQDQHTGLQTRLSLNRMIEAVQRDCDQTSALTGIDSISLPVLRAMKSVPRHYFVPKDLVHSAYLDIPLPIGCNQTISQPFIVALMTQLAAIDSTSRVLEVGTGSGYQAAILATIADEVFSMERVEFLARKAIATLAELGMTNVRVMVGDGQDGWSDHAPYDAMVVTAAVESLSPAWIEQLRPGGRIVAPIRSGLESEILTVVSKHLDGSLQQQQLLHVEFVPLVTGIKRPTRIDTALKS